jgi:hypothetical protein
MANEDNNTVNVRKIKIVINPEEISTPNNFENIRWEDDGGILPDAIRMMDDSQLPLKPGDTFKVLNGMLSEENGLVYYVADIEHL